MTNYQNGCIIFVVNERLKEFQMKDYAPAITNVKPVATQMPSNDVLMSDVLINVCVISLWSVVCLMFWTAL